MSVPLAAPAALRPRTISSPSSGPTRLRVPDLLHATDQAADDVLSGRCDHLLPPGGIPESRRWFTRIHGDEELDVWLISWVPGQHTELHDHGGSLGALTVVSGSLNEFRWDGRALRHRRLDAGDQAGFPLGWVHDVVWAPRPVAVPVSVAGRRRKRRRADLNTTSMRLITVLPVGRSVRSACGATDFGR